MIFGRPVNPRASRSALIVASVPDDTARTISIDGTEALRTSTNRTSTSVGAPNVVPAAIVSRMVSRISGCAWPRISGPQLPIRSMYSLPSASVIRAPRPLAMNTGSVPTDRHARTGEFTPPGMIALARSKMDWLRWVDIAGEPSPDPRARGECASAWWNAARVCAWRVRTAKEDLVTRHSAICLLISSLLLAPLPGCSFLSVHGPPENHAALTTFQCSESNAWPVLDGIWSLLNGLGALTAAGDDNNPDQGQIVAVGLSWFVVSGISAIYGFSKVSDCNKARQQRDERYAYPPP